VVCGALELDPADKTGQTVLNPAVLIEVQSPSTESDDRGPKLDGYKLIGSVRAIVLVAQDEDDITVHERRPDSAWAEARYEEGVVELAAIGCKPSVAEVYEELPDA
jgi:Uma2 family endonuclease